MEETLKRTMDRKKIIITLLLVVCSVISNFAQDDLCSISCKSMDKHYKLRITGNDVKLSDVDFSICKQPPKVVELFATEKAIIDTDLMLIGQEVQVVIIAPIWEVLLPPNNGTNHGGRNIILSGKNGKDFKEKQAKNGSKDSKSGGHGKAGRPGGPAGTFYGIANKIINAEQLAIFDNGGDGGMGQNGGDGMDGANGTTYKGIPYHSCSGVGGWKYVEIAKTCNVFADYYEYKILGKAAKNGGRGGNGGIGGMAGKKGSVIFFELSKSSKNSIQTFVDNGKQGSNGAGGRMGRGGINGKNVIVSHEQNFYDTFQADSGPTETNEIAGNATNGLEGKSGISIKRRKFPMNHHIPQSFASSVNGYKMFIRPYLADSNNTEILLFYNALGTDDNITKMYNTLSLVEQFTGLEKQFFKLNNKLDFVPSYNTLMMQINNYAKKPSIEENCTEYRNVIKDLQIDIKKSLKAVKSLQAHYDVTIDLEAEANRFLLPMTAQLEDFKKTYNILSLLKQNILLLDVDMENGRKVISDVAEKAIADLEDTLNEDLNSLLREITEMSEKEEDNQEELLKKREKLEDIMQLKAMYGILKVGCVALGVINPALGFAGAVASSAITVIEAKTTGDDEAKVAVIPKALENWANDTLSYFEKMKEDHEKVIKQQETFVAKIKKTTTIEGVAAVNRVWKSGENYRLIDKGSKNVGYDMMKVYAKKETELTMEIKKLEDEKSSDSKKINAAKVGLRVAKYLKTTSEAFQGASETIISIMQDEKKVSEIDAAIKKNEEVLQKLYLVEKSIYTQVEPLLDDMQTNFECVERDLGNMNEFQQAVAKWNITGTLKKIKRSINKVSEICKVNDDINRTFNRLLETFDLLFKTHNMLIEKKEEHKNKIFETNLHIAHASNLLISDSELRFALSELQLAQMSNQVARKYHQWICALKQKIFPYNGEMLNTLQDLDVFRGEGGYSFTNFVIDNMRQIIADFNSDVDSDIKKKVVFRGTNFPDGGSNFSFYVWKYEDNKEAFHNILNGKPARLFADIHKGDNEFNALKFNRVKLLFTAKNASLQEELTKELNNFDVKVIHDGISKYRYGDTIYEIKNKKTCLEFSYSANSKERETHHVSRLARGPYLLSPYATWTIKLLPIHRSYNFKLLNEFVGKVDLELIGMAEYCEYSDCDSTCKNVMKNCYTVAKN